MRNEPNKAMETTPVNVTIPAIAGLAPFTSVSHLGRWAKKVSPMKVRYLLELEDHLAWYDYYCTTQYGQHEKSKLPFIGKYLDRIARESFGRTINAKNNEMAFGERSLELRADGVREFSSTYDFVSTWPDIALVATTPKHLFIAHTSMNSHIVPLSAFASDEERAAFIRCAEARGSLQGKTPNQALEPTPTAVTYRAAHAPRHL